MNSLPKSDFVDLLNSESFKTDFDGFLSQTLENLYHELDIEECIYWSKSDLDFSFVSYHSISKGTDIDKKPEIKGRPFLSISNKLSAGKMVLHSNLADANFKKTLTKLGIASMDSWILVPITVNRTCLGFISLKDSRKRIWNLDDQNMVLAATLLIQQCYIENYASTDKDQEIDGSHSMTNKELSDLLFYTAHNLRHPMANLMSLLDLLKKVRKNEDGEDEVFRQMNLELIRLDDVMRIMMTKLDGK